MTFSLTKITESRFHFQIWMFHSLAVAMHFFGMYTYNENLSVFLAQNVV